MISDSISLSLTAVIEVPYGYHLNRTFSLTAFICIHNITKDGMIIQYQGVVKASVGVQSGELTIDIYDAGGYCYVKL